MVKPTGQECPVARTLSIIGGRWTILILRDLLLKGACRFHDFQESLKGIAPNTLSDRLKTLEAHGIVERNFYEQHPPRAEYALTPKGRELGAVVRALYDWGRKYGE
jgi:DNA-binding HxlR family transcriptional regulator